MKVVWLVVDWVVVILQLHSVQRMLAAMPATITHRNWNTIIMRSIIIISRPGIGRRSWNGKKIGSKNGRFVCLFCMRLFWSNIWFESIISRRLWRKRRGKRNGRQCQCPHGKKSKYRWVHTLSFGTIYTRFAVDCISRCWLRHFRQTLIRCSFSMFQVWKEVRTPQWKTIKTPVW